MLIARKKSCFILSNQSSSIKILGTKQLMPKKPILFSRHPDVHHPRDPTGQRAPGLPQQGLPAAGQGRDPTHASASGGRLS